MYQVKKGRDASGWLVKKPVEAGQQRNIARSIKESISDDQTGGKG
jgi:hypothetical protein